MDSHTCQQLQNLVDRGELKAALSLCQGYCQQHSDDHDARFMLGKIYGQADDWPAAAECFARLVKDRPDYPGACTQLGAAYYHLSEMHKSRHCLEKALSLNPECAETYNYLGLVMAASGSFEEALKHTQRAIALKPDFAEAYHNLSEYFFRLGNFEEAFKNVRQAIALKPDYAEAFNRLGVILLSQQPYTRRQLQEAKKCFHRAIMLDHGLAKAHNNLGVVLRDLGEKPAAIAEFQQAFRLKPDYAEAIDNLGIIYQTQGYVYQAIECYEKALEIKEDANVIIRLANAWKDLGQYDAAYRYYQRSLALQSGRDLQYVHSNILFLLSYHVLRSPAGMLAAHQEWGRRHGGTEKAQTFVHAGQDDPQRRLRIGYVSPDFRRHAVNAFFEPVLRHHDRSRVEVYCYAEVLQPDDVTVRLQGMVDGWRSSVAVDDLPLARQIHEDRIDILVDLAGHTAHNRLGVFAYRPAPIQVTYLGYCTTTGLATMDYWLTDAVLHPPDTVELAVEEIYRLPRCWLSYQPDENAPPVSTEAHDQVTFGNLNDLSKLTPQVIEVWSRILQAVGGSRLLLKTKQLADATVRQKLTEQFATQGIDAERLILLPATMDYLQTYQQIDIALDPFPRTGGATTADALWMGVPVITLSGERFIERQGVSMLTALGLEELVANSLDDYIRKAIDLAGDAGRRSQLHSTLRQRMADSSLCDGRGMAQALEQAYREMWQRYLGHHAV